MVAICCLKGVPQKPAANKEKYKHADNRTRNLVVTHSKDQKATHAANWLRKERPLFGYGGRSQEKLWWSSGSPSKPHLGS